MRIVDLEAIFGKEVYLEPNKNYYLTVIKDKFDMNKLKDFTKNMKQEINISVKVINGHINGIWELIKK